MSGEIFNAIDGLGGVDPYSSAMAITLDLICLSQPSEPTEDEEWRTPKDFLVKRKTSTDSFFGNQHIQVGSSDAEEEHRQRLISQVSRDDRFVVKWYDMDSKSAFAKKVLTALNSILIDSARNTRHLYVSICYGAAHQTL